MQDVLNIIQNDYDQVMIFEVIEFQYSEKIHQMGSYVTPFRENIEKKDIKFMFDGKEYDIWEEFLQNAKIDGLAITAIVSPIEVLKAGIVNGEPILSSPWGETRLSKYAIQQEE